MHATAKSATATTVAIDLAKDVFELAFADADAHIVERCRLSQTAFAKALDNRVPLRIVVEACGSAHYWARPLPRPVFASTTPRAGRPGRGADRVIPSSR